MTVRALAPAEGSGTIVFVIAGRIDPVDVTPLCDYVCEQLQTRSPTKVICDLGQTVASDAVAVEALARLQLAARRRGCAVRLRNASRELIELLALMGLDEVVPVADA